VPLLINADDFGLTPGVNRSVVELHRAGVLSSATLMATGAFFDDAVALASATPTLEVGCHVLLVDGVPVLPAAQIPSLCPDGQSFRPSLGRFAADLQLGRIRPEEIETEASAQIRRLQQTGLRVSHVDTHKHTHLFPRVLRPLLQAARACGVPAIRNPFEPPWARRIPSTASVLRRVEVALLSFPQPAFLRLLRQAGLATTAGTLGVLATGTADIPGALSRLLSALPAGTQTWELVCHPGYPDEHLDRVRTRLRASRGQEHAALLEQIPRAGVKIGAWRDLPAPVRA
jgi:chitin disaccharide deacetylase